jgi:hypothetical protein
MRKVSSKQRQRNIRKATAVERRKFSLGADATVEIIDLNAPNLAPEHCDNFIAMVRRGALEIDELIGRWYRHHGACGDPDCDCGGNHLAEQAELICSDMLAAKQLFGVVMIDHYQQLRRFVQDFGGDGYARLTTTQHPQ